VAAVERPAIALAAARVRARDLPKAQVATRVVMQPNAELVRAARDAEPEIAPVEHRGRAAEPPLAQRATHPTLEAAKAPPAAIHASPAQMSRALHDSAPAKAPTRADRVVARGVKAAPRRATAAKVPRGGLHAPALKTVPGDLTSSKAPTRPDRVVARGMKAAPHRAIAAKAPRGVVHGPAVKTVPHNLASAKVAAPKYRDAALAVRVRARKADVLTLVSGLVRDLVHASAVKGLVRGKVGVLFGTRRQVVAQRARSAQKDVHLVGTNPKVHTAAGRLVEMCQ